MIEEILKDESLDARLTCGMNKWLVWDGKEYKVYLFKRYARFAKVIESGSLDKCLQALKQGKTIG